MTSGFKTGTTDLDDVFAPYLTGTKPAATGLKVGNQDFRDRYAPLSQGTQAAPTGFKVVDADLNTIFAAKGTPNYTLGFDGESYSAVTARTTASLTLDMLADGTWSISKNQAAILASGTWLNYGSAASDYAVKFAGGGFTAGAHTGYANGAPEVSALTSVRSFSANAAAVTIGDTASNQGTLTVYLYKSGVLLGTSVCSFSVTSNDF